MRSLAVVALLAASAGAQDLAAVRRICVEPLNGDRSASQIRDMIIAALQQSGAFILTENPQRADAILKGSAEDLVYTDTYHSSEGLNLRAGMDSGVVGRTTSRRVPSITLGERETSNIRERRHEASASVRLVSRDGDVIWSTTQESGGAKFRSASADVAEKVARQLVQDVAKSRQPPSPSASK
ncbi:MAG TPA: hypothetical protein VFL57_19540 [Bryobacteraceae bacterium]|nr:hypothetical protein [Bryobacteraceae bacterium]